MFRRKLPLSMEDDSEVRVMSRPTPADAAVRSPMPHPFAVMPRPHAKEMTSKTSSAVDDSRPKSMIGSLHLA